MIETMIIRLLVVSLSCLLSESYTDNLPCAYSFHVWNPRQDIVQKVKDVTYKVENITGYIEREFLKMKSDMLVELKQCQNWTINLEREINDMKFKTIRGRIIERDTTNSVTDVERDINDLKKKVNHLKSNYQKMHRSRQISNIRTTPSLDARDKEMLDLLEDAVRDMKAEWVVIKRDVIDLQTEHREIKMARNKDSNYSFHIGQSLRAFDAQIKYNTINITDMINIQTDRQEKISEKIDTLKLKDEEQIGMTNLIQDRLTQVDEKISNLDKDFDLLKNDNAYMKKIVLASLKRGDNNNENTDEKGETKTNHIKGIPKDCQDIMEMGYDVSGVYQIKPDGAPDLDNVYCEILNDTAYTVIQRRTDGLLSFNRQWIEYKYGFGNLYGSHWVGNEWMHILTNQDQYTLRVDIWDWEGKKHFAEYAKFYIESQDVDYKLNIGDYTGNAGDSLSFHDGMKFSTEDMDNDLNIRHCAAENKSGWWFNNCYLSNLNGVYHVGYYSHTQYSDGIVWYTLKEDEKYSLRKVEMKLRRNV